MEITSRYYVAEVTLTRKCETVGSGADLTGNHEGTEDKLFQIQPAFFMYFMVSGQKSTPSNPVDLV
jgi:hypothetical protein